MPLALIDYDGDGDCDNDGADADANANADAEADAAAIAAVAANDGDAACDGHNDCDNYGDGNGPCTLLVLRMPQMLPMPPVLLGVPVAEVVEWVVVMMPMPTIVPT